MNWYRNMKISLKLNAGFLLIACLLVFVGYSGLNNLDKMQNSLSDMYDNNLVPIRDLSAVSRLYERIRVNVRDLQYANEDAAKKKEYIEKLESFVEEIDSRIAQYRATQVTDREKTLLDSFAPAWAAYKQLINKEIELADNGQMDAYVALMLGDLKTTGDDLIDVINQLVDLNVELAQERDQEGDKLFASSQASTFFVMVLSVLISFALGFLISRSISKPLRQVAQVAGEVAKGDLTASALRTSKDEIGQLANSMNEMVGNLRGIVTGVVSTAEGVSAAAQQISASTQEIAGGSTSQAHAAQTINELFKELTAATHAVAQIAEQASDISEDTMGIAERGGKAVRSSVEGMNQISLQVEKLEEDSNKIGEIIEVIDDIAEQTNLLALNAAIEAARAGDQGRGFAVVADEVRKLAERSGEATKRITDIIKAMQENTRQSVHATREGVQLSQQTGEAFDLIINKVNESADKVTEIAAASEEQSAQSAEVLSAVENISAVTEESAASCEETASAAHSLAGLAEELQHTVSVFKVK